MTRKYFLTLIAFAMLGAMFLTAPATAASDLFRSKAKLFGPTPMRGNAVYREKTKSNNQLLRRFKVQIKFAQPLQSYPVLLNGVQVGSVTANALGFGKFELRTPAFIDSPNDGLPMPSNFPRVTSGDTVSVGPVSGVVFIVKGSDDGITGNTTQWYRLRGEFDGPGEISGKARYRERFKKGNLERRFTVDVEDADPNTTLNITVNGVVVGTVTTDGSGEGELNLRTAAFIDDPNEWQPMPNTFPTLTVGDVVMIGGSTVVLDED